MAADVPPMLATSEVARACRWSTRYTRRLLRRAGIAELVGSAWMVGESRLRERLPEVYARVFEFYVLGAPKDPKDPKDTGGPSNSPDRA